MAKQKRDLPGSKMRVNLSAYEILKLVDQITAKSREVHDAVASVSLTRLAAVLELCKVAQATSKQMSKRDPLRPYMDVIDNLLAQTFREDPSFKPQGGQLGENDVDYDTDDKSMATLR